VVPLPATITTPMERSVPARRAMKESLSTWLRPGRPRLVITGSSRSRSEGQSTPPRPNTAAWMLLRETPAFSVACRKASSRAARAPSSPTPSQLDAPACPNPRRTPDASRMMQWVLEPPPSTPARHGCDGVAMTQALLVASNRSRCSLPGRRNGIVRDQRTAAPGSRRERATAGPRGP
jgi:hypothetical protein